MRLICLALLFALLMPLRAHAEEMTMMPKPDDRVVFDISAEDWVTTKTARVTAHVEAAVSGGNAGSMRADMMKAVDDLAKADWRLVSFNRGQDQTGLERWSASFEARLTENDLGGLADKAKRLSKAGMQLGVASIDFSPTLDETEAARAAVRAHIYKSANDQLAALNAAMPGRGYRISSINFTGDSGANYAARNGFAVSMAAADSSAQAAPAPMERSEKVTLTARITLAANPAPEAKH